jgi:hypothetical protein
MTLKHLLAGAAVAATLLGAAGATAGTKVLGTEGESGFVGDLFMGAFAGFSYTVASDGEAPFDPFGAGYDTSDGLDLSYDHTQVSWVQAPDSHWNAIRDQVWVLPAVTDCGAENEPECEPVGHWVATDGAFWRPETTGTWLILEGPNGGLSDRIVTYNVDGVANIQFYSDPSLGVPEPMSWTLMVTGFGMLGAGARLLRRRQSMAA